MAMPQHKLDQLFEDADDCHFMDRITRNKFFRAAVAAANAAYVGAEANHLPGQSGPTPAQVGLSAFLDSLDLQRADLNNL